MKIALVHRNLPPESCTGVAVQVHRLANSLSQRNHEVVVFTLSQKPEDALYKTQPWPNSIWKDLNCFFPFLKRLWAPLQVSRLKFSTFDTIHIHGDGGFTRYSPNMFRTFYGTASLEARHAKTWRAKIAQQFSFLLEQREAKQCQHSVAISRHIIKYLPNILTTIPCMVANQPIPKSLQLKTQHPTLLYLGSQGGRKRGELALQMHQQLRVQFNDLELIYIGPESERKQLSNSALYPGILFHSQIPESELMKLFGKAWIYICFSSYEGFGVPWAEAMSMGCCVVTAPHAAAKEWLRDGENALLREPHLISQAVSELIRYPGLREKLLTAGIQAAEIFSTSSITDQYLSLYANARLSE